MDEDVSPGIFDSFYTNCAPESWIMNIRKVNSSVFHTFVKYGLITSFENGRSGSHFGISIRAKNYYFNNIKLLHELFEKIEDVMLDERKLIGKNKFDQRGFIPKSICQESDYLDNFSQRIKNVFKQSEFNDNFKQLPLEIPNGERYYKVHINSNQESFYNYFKETGCIQVSDYKDYICGEKIK